MTPFSTKSLFAVVGIAPSIDGMLWDERGVRAVTAARLNFKVAPPATCGAFTGAPTFRDTTPLIFFHQVIFMIGALQT